MLKHFDEDTPYNPDCMHIDLITFCQNCGSPIRTTKQEPEHAFPMPRDYIISIKQAADLLLKGYEQFENALKLSNEERHQHDILDLSDMFGVIHGLAMFGYIAAEHRRLQLKSWSNN